MRLVRAGGLALCVALAFAACTNALEVNWDTYQPSLQAKIDSAEVVGDCGTLLSLHDAAVATSEAHRQATGVDNQALVDYIEAAQHEAGCPV